MHYQVMNGGVIQFVDNGSGDNFEETLTALKEIKATEYIEILEKFKSKVPNGVVPKNMEERRAVIDKLNDSLPPEELEEFYESLDKEYYKSENMLHQYVIEFTKQYIGE